MTETETLRSALLDIIDPIPALQKEHPDMPWENLIAVANEPEYLKSIARKALTEKSWTDSFNNFQA